MCDFPLSFIHAFYKYLECTLQLFTFFHSSVTAFVTSFHHLVSEIKIGSICKDQNNVLFHQMGGTRPLKNILNAQLGNCKPWLFLESRGRELADCLEQSIWQFSGWFRAVIWLCETRYQL